MRHKYLLSLVLLLALTENILMEIICNPGQIRKRGKCEDENECETNPSICGRKAKCFNTVGSYYCQCLEGFKTYSAQNNSTLDHSIECKDINECKDGSIDCGPHTVCNNSEGGYNCVCATGYISSNGKDIFPAGQGVQCTDINECSNGSIDCGPHTVCNNSEGGYNCTCDTGYISSNGQAIFTAGQGVQCNELNCSTLSEINTSQASPELEKFVSLMTNSCLALSTQGDGKRPLEAFIKALDDLFSGDFKCDNTVASKLFKIVENMLKLIGPQLSESQTKRSSNTIELEMLVKRGNSPPEGDFMMSTNDIQFTSHWDTATGNNHLGFTTAALLSYNSLHESLNCCFNQSKTTKKQSFKINSKVVTATVSNKDTGNLTKPVYLTFSHLEKKNENHICVFWDHKLNGWSTEGCTKVRSSDNQTVCSCTHLSSFAVLMALYDIGDVYELRLVTLVGLPLSLICFFICIVTFYFVRSIQSTRNTIHLHLCISLFIAYFVFLVGITRTENEVGCAVFAGIQHYFFLASFCWMCLEGVQLFRMVVLVFNTTLRPLYMFAAGYGAPAVIVAISASVNASGYGTEKYCWLNIEDGFIWSFYGPVCVIIIVNVLFFLITIWKLAEKFSSLNPDLDSLHKIKAFTVTAIAQLCILGIMWVFGCFQFNENTLAMSYIFTILSSLQGVLMFIMHCWLSKPVRDEYAKFLSCICTPQKRKYSEFSSNQSKSQASKSVQHTGESQI